jgi:phospholipid/cholesterol/gamma-HCH transport system substrate-binding protein
MKRSIHVKWGNLRVGILLMIALAALVWASFSGSGTSIFESKARFICYFRNVNGLLKGSPVWMSGVEVGNVAEVKFVNIDSIKQVQVTCRVKESIWPMLTQDASVQLGTIGFLGDRYVEIVPGSKDLPMIKEMDVVATRNVGEATAMFKKGEEAAGEFRKLGANLDTLMSRMNAGEGTLGKMARDTMLYVNLTKLTASLATLSDRISKNQERLFTSMETAAISFKDMSAQLAKKDGTLGKVIEDPALYNNLNASIARLDSIMTKVNAGTGSAGLLVNDTTLYVQTANLLERVNNLLTDMQANPRKYFKFSVF